MEISQMKRSEKREDFACVMTQAVLAIFRICISKECEDFTNRNEFSPFLFDI